jgi:hypothetical protein
MERIRDVVGPAEVMLASTTKERICVKIVGQVFTVYMKNTKHIVKFAPLMHIVFMTGKKFIAEIVMVVRYAPTNKDVMNANNAIYVFTRFLKEYVKIALRLLFANTKK